METRIYDAEMDKTTDLAKIDEHEKELNKLKSQFGWLQVTRVKLLMDLIFVCESCLFHISGSTLNLHARSAYDLFKFRRGRDSTKTLTGLTSGFLR